MDVPAGFTPFPNQGPFLEYVGPIHVHEDGDELRLGLRAEERHANHRGTVQGGMLSTFADFALGRAIEADADDDGTLWVGGGTVTCISGVVAL